MHDQVGARAGNFVGGRCVPGRQQRAGYARRPYRPHEIKDRGRGMVHFDFGIKRDEYCSDIQRVLYVLRPGGSEARNLCVAASGPSWAIQAAVAAMKPGVTGSSSTPWRRVVTDASYPGSSTPPATTSAAPPTAAAWLGPLWERYGDTPNYPLEAGHVHTVEPGLLWKATATWGWKDVLVTEGGHHLPGRTADRGGF